MFENQIGLWALLSLVPFIIIYLRRPRPQDKVIPSLMFLIKDKKTSQKYSFFRKLIHNLLFLLQLLALLLLSVSVAAPFVRVPYDVTLENTVLIIDSSGSMQAEEKGMRFEKAIKEAKKVLSGKNSIILAENIPLIALEDESTDVALDILSKLPGELMACTLIISPMPEYISFICNVCKKSTSTTIHFGGVKVPRIFFISPELIDDFEPIQESDCANNVVG